MKVYGSDAFFQIIQHRPCVSGEKAAVADSRGRADLRSGEGCAGQTGSTQEFPGEDRNLHLSSGPIIDVKYTAGKSTQQLLPFDASDSLRVTVTVKIQHQYVTASAATRPLMFQSSCRVKKIFLKKSETSYLSVGSWT